MDLRLEILLNLILKLGAGDGMSLPCDTDDTESVTVEYLDCGAVPRFCKHFLIDEFYLRAQFFPMYKACPAQQSGLNYPSLMVNLPHSSSCCFPSAA